MRNLFSSLRRFGVGLNLRIAESKRVYALILLLFSIGAALYFHRYVFEPHLRDAMIASGNISDTVGDILDPDISLFKNYRDIVKWEDRSGGRYRPLFFFYEAVPFFLTMVKDGNFVPPFDHPSLRNRINGDLRFHSIFLLLTIVASTWLGSLLVFQWTRSVLCSAVFPFYVFLSTAVIEENILQNYCDSQEIPQVLWAIMYLYTFFETDRRIVQGKSGNFFLILVSTFFGVLTYLTKETSLVFCLPVCIFVIWIIVSTRFVSVCRLFQPRILHLLFHMTLNLALAIWVLAHIIAFRPGQDYSMKYRPFDMTALTEHFRSLSGILLSNPVFGVVLGVVGALFVVLIFGNWKEWRAFASSRQFVLPGIAVFFLLLGCGFMLVNLPWEWPLAKYLYPAAFFLALAAALFQGCLWTFLLRSGRRTAACVFVLPMMTWALIKIPDIKRHNNHTYENAYANRRLVVLLAEDIAVETNPSLRRELSVHIASAQAVSDIGIQLNRILNQDYHINLLCGKVFLVNGPYSERSYFKVFPENSRLRLTITDRWPELGQYDVVYIIRQNGGTAPQVIESKDIEPVMKYILNDQLSWRGRGRQPDYFICKYYPADSTQKNR